MLREGEAVIHPGPTERRNMSWENELDPVDKVVWDAFVQQTREDAMKKIDASAFVMSLVPKDEPDVKFCVELGLSVMYDKPLVIVVAPETRIPERLQRLADEVIVCDIDTAEGRDEVATRLQALAERL